MVKADGKVLLNAQADEICGANCEILSISEDDDTTIPSFLQKFEINEDAIKPSTSKTDSAKPERNLVLGWNRFMAPVISELDEYVQKGSKLTIACAHPDADEDLKSLHHDVKNHEIEHVNGDTDSRSFLESLPLGEYDNILILPYNPDKSDDYEDIDASTITTLVYVRDIEQEKKLDLSITTEMLLEESRAVADLGAFGDFVVGDEIIGRIIAQLAEESRLKEVFRILLTVEGNEIYIKPISDFVKTGVNLNGYTLLEAAKRKGELYIGYVKGHDIIINPSKLQSTTFSEDDKIIVVAEN